MKQAKKVFRYLGATTQLTSYFFNGVFKYVRCFASTRDLDIASKIKPEIAESRLSRTSPIETIAVGRRGTKPVCA